MEILVAIAGFQLSLALVFLCNIEEQEKTTEIFGYL
jgi:hypothetical protein